MLEFSADEVFAAAAQLEADAQRFYETASQQVDAQTGLLLKSLARWEGGHKARFESLRKDLSLEPALLDGEDDVDGDRAQYLKAMVNGRVFPVQIPTLTDRAAVLAYALQREFDSIVFFLTLRDLVPRFQGREQIDQILSDEAAHVRLLQGAILKGTGGTVA